MARSVPIVFALVVALAPSLAAQGSVVSLGAGCPDSNGRTPVLAPHGLPIIGNSSFAFITTIVSPLAPTYIFLALGTASPQTLAPGCDLYLDYPSMIALVNLGASPLGPQVSTGPAGTAHFFPIANVPSLVGATFAAQAAVLDPNLTLGFVVSNALSITIG